MSELNPQIKKISVGTRELREVTVYPLSMHDQFKMTDTIVDTFKQFSEVDLKDMADTDIVSSMISLVEENLTAILKLVIDGEENVKFTELTNDQFSDLVTIIFEVNYESSIKKFQTLISKVKGVMPKMAAVNL